MAALGFEASARNPAAPQTSAALEQTNAAEPAIRFADAQVFHARLRPNGLRFRYRVLALFVDIDRLGQAMEIPFFALDRFHLFSFHRADHGPRDGTSLRAYIDRIHAEAHLPSPAKVMLTCFPRILGYAFNPIATYWCRDEAGQTTSIVYEVRNTFGEHHTYLCPLAPSHASQLPAHECDKLFYVSPFMDMPLRYRFLLKVPQDDETLSLKIIERDQAGVVLTALMQARQFPATRYALLMRLLATPLLGFKIIAAIHWQALRLVWRGHRLRQRPAPPAPISIDTAGAFSAALSSPNTPHPIQ